MSTEEHDDYDDAALAQQKATHSHSTEEHEAILRLDPNDESIELNNLRLFSFDEVDLSRLVNCTALELRKNLIHKLAPLPRRLRDQLVVLDLFDNKIRTIGPYFSASDSPAFATSRLPLTMPELLPANGGNGCLYRALRKLDLSYNQISVIRGLDDLAGTLEELYLVENRIRQIEGLSLLVNLKLLELGGNQIRSCEHGLETLVNLEQLWLGKNKIDTIGDGLRTLRKLRRVSFQANRLTDASMSTVIFPAGAHPDLEELYLSENGLTLVPSKAFGGPLPNLLLVDLSFNPVASLQSDGWLTPTNLPRLDEFWLTDGELQDWAEMEAVFQPFAATLRTIYLERNPLEKDTRYRSKVFAALPFLKQIDSWPVVNKSNPDADRATRQ